MIYKKPKNEIFASDAKDGEIVEFPNIKRGWGVTENLGFIPPMEYFNAAFNRIDKSIAYQLQRGVGEWDKDLEYPIGAVVSLNGVVYVAKSQNTNKNPANEVTIWDIVATQKWCEGLFALKTELTDGLPIGAYLSYPSQKTIPAGFLIADGRSLKKAEYTELFDVLGYVYGGSGENFNLPNFADGKFMRGIGGNAAGLGVVQQDEIKSHTHGVGQQPGVGQSNNGGTGDFAGQNSYIQSGATGGNETRPYNMAVVVIIKAKNVNTPIAGQIDKTMFATEAKSGIVKLKNSITAKQEDAAVTEKAVSEFVAASQSGLGIDQTWQDVKDQRQAGVTYTNTTGRPIMVCIQATMNYGVATCPIFVDGIKVGEVWEHHTVNKVDHVTFIVPNGSTYKADLTIGVHSIFIWSELR